MKENTKPDYQEEFTQKIGSIHHLVEGRHKAARALENRFNNELAEFCRENNAEVKIFSNNGEIRLSFHFCLD